MTSERRAIKPAPHCPIWVGARIPAEAVATIIRESRTYRDAGVLLTRSPEDVRKLAFELRERGYDCGPLRTGESQPRPEFVPHGFVAAVAEGVG